MQGSQKSFQIDADKRAPSTNKIEAETVSANKTPRLNHRFENQPQTSPTMSSRDFKSIDGCKMLQIWKN